MSEAKSLFQADQDLSDIRVLQKLPAFERYFLRRLAEKRDHFAALVLDSEATPEQREIWRQIYQEYKALCSMVEQDEANAVKLLGSASKQ
jgi:arylsulfatase A-like enzyme